MNRLDLNIRLQAIVYQDEGVWVAICPSLDVGSQGESHEAALQSLREAVTCWFDSCLERGVLREALEDIGWRRNTDGAFVLDDAHGVQPKNMTPAMSETEISVEVPAYVASSFLQPAEHAPN